MDLIFAIDLIKKFEGISLKAYKCSADVWTIGYGNTSYLKRFKNPVNVHIMQKQAESLLMEDIMPFYEAVMQEVGKICSKNQIDALISFAFNVGVGAFKKSTLLKVIKNNPKNFIEIKKEFLRWNKAGGKVVKGLTNRRLAEYKIYSL